MPVFATWSIPSGVAADKNKNLAERYHHYRFNMTHKLIDGTKIIPNVSDIVWIIKAFDDFGPHFPVAIEDGSYYIPEENNI